MNRTIDHGLDEINRSLVYPEKMNIQSTYNIRKQANKERRTAHKDISFESASQDQSHTDRGYAAPIDQTKMIQENIRKRQR